MKKVILGSVFSLFFLALSFTGALARGVPTIFSDPNYSQATNNFVPGQTVYLKIVWRENGNVGKTLRLLNSNESEVNRYSLNQSGDSYLSSFNAPSTPGTYYLDVKIDNGTGSVLANRQNINVVGSQSSGSVAAASTSVTTKGGLVEGQSAVIEPTVASGQVAKKASPAVTPFVLPGTTPQTEEPASLFERIRQAIKNFFDNLKLR